MYISWWRKLLDRYRGRLWPVHYRINGSSWWVFRNRTFLYKPWQVKEK